MNPKVSAPTSFTAMQATLTKISASATTTTNAINGLFPYFAHPSTEEKTMSDLIEWETQLTAMAEESDAVQAPEEVTSVPAQLWKHPEEATREQLLFMHTRLLERSRKEAKKSAEANQRLEALEEKVRRADNALHWAGFYLGYAMQNQVLGILPKVANFIKLAADHLKG